MRYAISFLLIGIVICCPALAGDFTFVATTGDWDTGTNWDDGGGLPGPPEATDTATVGAGKTCTVDEEAFAKTLTIAGTVIVDGDTLTIGAQGTGTVLDIDSGGTLTIDLGGVVEIEEDSVIDGDIVVDDGGTLEIGEGSLESSGSITVLDGGEITFALVDADFDMQGEMEIQDGGVVTITASDSFEESDFDVIGSLDVQSGGLLEVNIPSGGDEPYLPR